MPVVPLVCRNRKRRASVARMRSVGEMISARLAEMGQTETWLERRLGIKHRGVVNKVVSGKRWLPRRSVESWCAALGLHGAAADAFRLAAHIQRDDPIVGEAFDRLAAERDAAQSLLTDYATRVDIIRGLIADLAALHPVREPTEE